MKRKIWVNLFLFMIIALAGCAPGLNPGQPSPSPTTAPTPFLPTPSTGLSSTPDNQSKAAEKAREMLAHDLGISPEQVVIRQVEQVDWPDSCLGAPAKDEMCAQMVTPGYRVILEAQGKMHEYHTNQDGRMIRSSGESQNSSENQAVGQAVVQKAAQDLSLDAAGIRVVHIEAVEWPDSCLGIQEKGRMCLMVITPGYRVIVEASGQNYEYHTDRTASRIVRFMGK